MMLPRLSNNTELPVLNGFAARSTWLIVIAAAVTVCNAIGVDLMGVLGAMGIGATPDQVIEAGERVVAAWQTIAPLALSIWAWIERRAPSFRLVWPWPSIAAVAPGLALFAALTWPGAGQSLPAACASRAEILAALWERFEEVPVAVGSVAGGLIEMTLAPDGSFTLLLSQGDRSCILASGLGWTMTAPPPGEPV